MTQSNGEGDRPGEVQGDRLVATLHTEALAAIIADSDDAIISKDLRGIIQSWNSGATRVFGYSAEEAIGQSVTILIPPDRRDEEPGILERIRRGERIDHYETMRRRKDGELIEISITVSPLCDRNGRIVGASKIARDITAPNRAAKANAHLAAIVESSDDAIISKDLNGIIQSWNASAQRLFGYTAAEIIGRPVLTLIPGDRPGEAAEILSRLRHGQRVDHLETVRRRKDGSLVEVSLTVSPVWDSKGRVVGASKILRDITERKRVERAMMDADRQKNEFLATLAHELRNPLAPIRNSLHILRMTGTESPVAEQLHEVMERQVNHMVRLVDDLLELSRITTGKIELRIEPVDIAAVIRSAVETSRPLIDAGRHELVIVLPAQPMTVNGDLVRLSQVVGNLLNNAAKYSDPEGHITITVRQEGAQCVVSVRDTGIGIAADALPHVLKMFTQIEKGRKHSQGGLGIGLSLVQRLVELHGGSVEARSEGEGQGSEFLVRLPLADLQLVGPASPSEKEPETKAARQRILVVDDNRDAATSLAMFLRLIGCDVTTVNSGQEALSVARQFTPHYVLLDLGMPKMSGFDVARQLRLMPELTGVQIVALTGWGQQADRDQTQEAGFDHHLVKPVNLDELKSLLTQEARVRRGTSC